MTGGLSGFLRWWYGPPNGDPQRRGIEGVPEPLRAWYEAEDAWGRTLALQNSILRPARLRIEDGLTVFYVENQNVWQWAYGSGDDPEVFDRKAKAGAQWVPSGAALSVFLLHAAMFEAAIASSIGVMAVDLDRDRFERVVRPLTPVTMTAWHWPPAETRLYTGERIVAFGTVWPSAPFTADSVFQVCLAGKSNADLAYLDDADISWSYNSRKFGEGVYC